MVEIMTVSEQIIQVVDVLCEKFGIVVDWTNGNVIPYIEMLCEKLITYEICTSIAWMTIMILLSVGSIVAAKKLIPTFKTGLANDKRSYDCGWEIGTIFAIIGFVILNFITIIVVIDNIMNIIKCAVFPEMYIFEYISKFIK